MGVQLGDAAVRRPAGVAETVVRRGAVRARGLLQVLEVADGAHVLEPVGFAQRDPGGVVAAVLEPLEAREQKLLALPRPDVSDDPAHASPPSSPESDPRTRKSPAYLSRRRECLAELPLNEGCDPSTVLQGFLLRFGLAEDADERLRARRADEDPARAVEL